MPRRGAEFSAITRKQIDELPEHAKHIYKKTHASALRHYKSPAKRRGGRSVSREEVAHKVAWAAVRRKYGKSGGEWKEK
jgi:cation transport regulator